jgi:hypothetical protein
MPDKKYNSERENVDSWVFGLALKAVEEELNHIGAGDNLGVYLSIIETRASTILQSKIRAEKENCYKNKQQAQKNSPREILRGYAAVLDELNKFVRKLERSRVTEKKIQKNLSQLSDDALDVIRTQLTFLLGREVDLRKEDWSENHLQNSLGVAAKNARAWVRQPPGPATAENIHNFCREVILVFTQITDKRPGIGGSDAKENYMTPFERLWYSSYRLVSPYATVYSAREILRQVWPPPQPLNNS